MGTSSEVVAFSVVEVLATSQKKKKNYMRIEYMENGTRINNLIFIILTKTGALVSVAPHWPVSNYWPIT
jgi:hypothetical protein